MTIARPPRTDAHATRDALLQQFKDAGLQATISTNGSIPDADLEQTTPALKNGGKYGDVTECVITSNGQARLDAAFLARVAVETIGALTNRSEMLALPDHAPGAWEQSE